MDKKRLSFRKVETIIDQLEEKRQSILDEKDRNIRKDRKTRDDLMSVMQALLQARTHPKYAKHIDNLRARRTTLGIRISLLTATMWLSVAGLALSPLFPPLLIILPVVFVSCFVVTRNQFKEFGSLRSQIEKHEASLEGLVKALLTVKPPSYLQGLTGFLG